MNYNKFSDEELVLFIQKHGGKGFEEIIERYQVKLLRYVGNLCNDNEAAKDIVQETFISVYQNINSFDTKRKFSSWIYRIAHNKAVNEWRKNANKVGLDSIREIEGNINAPEIAKGIDQRQANAKVKIMILSLPDKYRDPLILRHYEEKSYDEISDILRIPTSTVGVRIKRGIDKIRKKIDIKIEDYL